MCRGLGRGLDRADVSHSASAPAMVLPAPEAEKRSKRVFPRKTASDAPWRRVFVAPGHHPCIHHRAGRRGGGVQVLRCGSFGAVRTLRIMVTARMLKTTPSDTATGILNTSIKSIFVPMNTSTTARP